MDFVRCFINVSDLLKKFYTNERVTVIVDTCGLYRMICNSCKYRNSTNAISDYFHGNSRFVPFNIFHFYGIAQCNNSRCSYSEHSFSSSRNVSSNLPYWEKNIVKLKCETHIMSIKK